MKAATCGQCAWALPHPNGDLRLRACHGGPPQIVATITPKGVQISQFWPQVTTTDQTCGVFKLKGTEPLPFNMLE